MSTSSLPHPARPAPTPWIARRWSCSPETLALLASLYFAVAVNGGFWTGAMQGRSLSSVAGWGHALALFAILAGLQFVLLGLLLTRRSARPLLALLFVAAALAAHAIGHYGVYLDPAMLRNALKTDAPEVRELITPALWRDLLLVAGPPLLLLWRLDLPRRPLRRALVRRALALGLGLAVVVAALLADFQGLASLMRNHKELRYLVTPTNLVYSLARAATPNGQRPAEARIPIGSDARLGPAWAASARPVLMVVVVGETARSANWGLAGYARQTTPGLAARAPLSFPRVSTCGTDTETSVPCLFARIGRQAYDETRIHREQSLLHLLARTGLDVQWIDNQSGCKGVCDGLPTRQPKPADHPSLCDRDRCLDDVLLRELDQVVHPAAAGPSAAPAGQVVVLHMLGNHGPAYYRRYPADEAPYQPACQDDDLSRCTRDEIVNAYDNALRHTDQVLSAAIDRLRALASTHDVALVYVSDHGESLGEKGLFLHGMPYAIAPDEQKQVPMILWMSDGYAQRFGVDRECLRRQAAAGGTSHDHLFHSLLGLLDVQTATRAPALDLAAACRS